jgi:putative toxin-antitoxin system antitoxin component (TIGR02293 family)
MASLVGVSERTISRLQKEHKRLNATGSDRLYRLARIAAHALEVFEDRNTVGNWLSRPNRALGGVAPVEVLDTDAGTEQVSELLNRIEYGVYI